MKQVKQTKKLTLNKQTIAVIDGNEMKGVRGGAASIWTFVGDCTANCTDGDICELTGVQTLSKCILP